jgi:dGTPase
VLHSAALRRLAAKTQVVVPWESDFPRTRLTHSLECAQVGRELGKALGCDPDLVEAACLAHDLGHPPFGHTGEAALDELAQDCGGFEGNAQSLRILTRLEAKAFAPDGRSVGLNLTRATLDAACKYPWPRDAESGTGGKYGVYDDDLDAFAWVRQGRAEERCLESQVMDWSDDVAYSVHDLEDGVVAGQISLSRLHRPEERQAVAELAAQHYSEMGVGELKGVYTTLLDEPWWPQDFAGRARDLAALKNATSTLIGRFCRAAEVATRDRFGDEALTRYAADLVVPRQERAEVALLKAVTALYVMGRPEAAGIQRHEREVVAALVERLAERAPAGLEPYYWEQWDAAGDDAARMRVVVDQVAALTDAAALAVHAQLTPA